ncbi:ABC transporter permease [Spiroplasma endosymbiont of Megaselia nigra]|uniref:ABC transporter permease n=1 Tax=Spiroplasma endosymbiont of Megaselia nigra TaxID=2478537 RepID=UPI000F884537|nr:ABC transporter permease [Spiroplasma endosymbiont of Megaselia nigra]RUO86692.1 ABC transporter permease [Spiroplasma endosymbiont of Megaselia nigra]
MKKILLMKQGILGIIKAKGQFISLLLLIFICSIITSCLFTTVTSLQSANRQMGYGSFDYNYSFHYSAMDFENSNMQTITPSFAFDTEYVLVENNDNKLTYPKITIGAAATDVFTALKPSDINFKLTNDKIRNLTLNLTLRTTAPNYQNSLIAKLRAMGYNALADQYFKLFYTTQIYKNFLGIITDYINTSFLKKQSNATNEEIKVSIANFINGKATSEQRAIERWDYNLKINDNYFTKFDIPDITLTLGKQDNKTVVTNISENTLFEKGLRGSFGVATRFNVIDTSGNKETRIQYLAQSPWQYIDKLNQTGINEARMVIGGLFNKVTFFGNYSERSSFLNFVQTYYKMLSVVSNFDIAIRQEVTTWDIANNLKYKVIGWHDLLKEEQLKLFDKVNEWSGPSLNESTISNYYAVVSPNYLKAHHKNLRDNIQIGERTFTIGASVGDTLNIYPTIYETDFIPDFKTDVVIYLSSYGMSLLEEDNNKGLISLKDNSRVFLKSLTNRTTENLAIFKKYYANNPNQLDFYAQMLTKNSTPLGNDPSIGAFEPKEVTSSLTRRYDLLAKTINVYIYIGLFFIIIFAITLFAVSYIIIKEMIKRESAQIGMLKAAGYYLHEIALSYWSILMVSILIAVPTGWLVGITVQLFVVKLFNMFFIINWSFTWNWMILLFLIGFFVIFLSLITFITCYFSINKTEVLSLIHPMRELKVNNSLARTVRSFHFKTFVGRFRMVVLSTSLKQAFTYLGIFSLVTFTLTVSLLAPVYAKNFNTNYYKNIKYGSEVKYSNVISNNPFSYYKTYAWNGIDNVPKSTDPIEQDLYPIGGITPLANYYSIDGGAIIKPLKAVKQEPTVAGILKDMLSYNFVTLSGTNLSLGIFNYLNNLVKNSSAGDSVRVLVSEILCTVLPKALGIGAIPYPPFTDNEDYPALWRTCFSKATNGIIPAAVKEDWNKNPDRANHFALGIGTMSYNPATDDVFTSFDGTYNDKQFPIYGINPNTKMLKLSSAERDILANNNGTVINAIANVTALHRLNLNVGEEIELTPEVTTLQYNTGQHEWVEFTNNNTDLKYQNWKYNLSGNAVGWNVNNYQSLYSLDKSYFTYNTSSQTKYYVTADRKSEYHNLNNVELWIPTNSAMEAIWSKKIITLSNGLQRILLKELTVDGNKIIRKERVDNKEYWVIKPYNFSFGGTYSGDFIDGIPTTWYQAAVDNNFIKAAPSLTQKPVKVKIVKSISTYDTPRLFISINDANQINSFSINKIDNNLNIMQWYNGKYTTELQPSDQINRYALSSTNGDLSLNNFTTSYNSSVLTADYVGIKAKIMSRVIIVALSVVLIFIVIIIMVSVITIYFAIDLFIKKFIKIIATMKVQGYSRWEINNLTLGIFIPFAVVGWLLGYFITWGLAWTITQRILMFFNFYVPIGTGLITLPIILGGIIILYVISYLISMKKINQLNIQEIVMMES